MRTILGIAGIFCTVAFAQSIDIPYQSFTLDNGLKVLVHEDHSDAVVAVYVSHHVGSGRESLGKSGFAHLFEHMLFQGLQDVRRSAFRSQLQAAD